MATRRSKTRTSDDSGARFRTFETTQVVWPILGTVLTVAFLFLVLTYVFDRFTVDNNFLPENNLPVLLITGTVALLVTVAALVIIFARLGLTSWHAALGLPEGSIRAIIALLLIVLFFITAVFLYADVGRDGPARVLNGISQQRFDAIPTAEIQASTQHMTNGVATYDVTVSSPKNQDSRDIAKQLVTTVSTLVVAIASFYFGANSVQTATNKNPPPPDAQANPPPKVPPAATPTTTVKNGEPNTAVPEPHPPDSPVAGSQGAGVVVGAAPADDPPQLVDRPAGLEADVEQSPAGSPTAEESQ